MGLKKRSDMTVYIWQIYMLWFICVYIHTTKAAKPRTWEKSDAHISKEA